MNALRLYYLAVYFGLGALWPLLALAFSARGMKPSEYAWLMALMPCARLISPPLWGQLADTRFGARKLLCINTWFAALAMTALLFVQGFWPTALAYGVWAFFNSSLSPLVEAGTYQLLGARAAAFGYVRVFGSLGFALSALLVGQLTLDSALRIPIALAALGYLLAALSAHKLSEFAALARNLERGAFRRLARRTDVLLLWLGSLLYYAAHAAFDMYFGPFLRALPGGRPALASTGWAVGVLAEVLALLLVPHVLRSRAQHVLLPLCAGLAVLRWLLTAHVGSAFQLMLLQPLHGVTYGVWYLAFVHANQAAAPGSLRATMQGVGAACLGVGTMVATVLGGYAFERVGGRPLFTLAALLACGALLLYVLRAQLTRRAPAQVQLLS